MKRTLLSAVLTATIAVTATAQNVNIPDVNFKNALLNHIPVIDTDSNGEISVAEAQAFTGAMNVSNKSISDLTGIEAFTNLTFLNCAINELTSLDVSNNPALTRLNCSMNFHHLSLNVSNNPALTRLECYMCELTDLNVSSCIALTYLHCSSNLLTSLDVSNNTALTYLDCLDNDLTSLDVSNNPALGILICRDNQLTSLTLSNSSNTSLTYVECRNNQLTSLDVSNNAALTYLSCFQNQLTSLNVANGNNTNFTFLAADENPNLTCIQVDDAAYSNTNWTEDNDFYKPTGAIWSEDCGNTTGINEASHSSITTVYPNPTNNILNIEVKETANIKIVNMLGATVATQKLNAGNNSIDVSTLTQGIYFIQSSNGGAVKFIKE